MGILKPCEPIELPESHDWHFEKMPPMMNRGPYMLGAPPLAFECHHPFRKTRPCYRFLKGCTLTCPCCRYKRQFTSYVGLLDVNNPRRCRIVVSGGKKTWLDVRSAKPGALVYLNRGSLLLDTIRIKVTDDQLEPVKQKVWLSRVQDDLSPYLFHLWQIRELTEHFGQQYYPSKKVLENAASEELNEGRPDGTTIE